MAGRGRPTREDVARHAGVSSAVVSYVVNDGPRPVANQTKARVLESMRTLGYRPNGAARALKLARTNVLGLLVNDLSNPFFAEFAKHLQDAALRHGFAVLVASIESDLDGEVAALRSLLEREVDGIVAFGIRSSALLTSLLRSGVPFVSMDRQLHGGTVPSILADDYQAARVAVEHLVEHGHTEIGYIGGPEHLLEFNARHLAWSDVVGPKLSADRLKDLQVHTSSSRQGGYQAILHLLQEPRRPPSALFASSDVQAIGALSACHSAGIRVPEDLALAAFDGTAEATYAVPPITAATVPTALMAERAVQRLLAPTDTTDLHLVVPAPLVRRESCGCTDDPTARR